MRSNTWDPIVAIINFGSQTFSITSKTNNGQSLCLVLSKETHISSISEKEFIVRTFERNKPSNIQTYAFLCEKEASKWKWIDRLRSATKSYYYYYYDSESIPYKKKGVLLHPLAVDKKHTTSPPPLRKPSKREEFLISFGASASPSILRKCKDYQKTGHGFLVFLREKKEEFTYWQLQRILRRKNLPLYARKVLQLKPFESIVCILDGRHFWKDEFVGRRTENKKNLLVMVKSSGNDISPNDTLYEGALYRSHEGGTMAGRVEEGRFTVYPFCEKCSGESIHFSLASRRTWSLFKYDYVEELHTGWEKMPAFSISKNWLLLPNNYIKKLIYYFEFETFDEESLIFWIYWLRRATEKYYKSSVCNAKWEKLGKYSSDNLFLGNPLLLACIPLWSHRRYVLPDSSVRSNVAYFYIVTEKGALEIWKKYHSKADMSSFFFSSTDFSQTSPLPCALEWAK